VPSVAATREGTGLSQPRFAELLGVSVRTLQEWEQGRRAPSGAARTLLLIDAKHPRALPPISLQESGRFRVAPEDARELRE
jgi:putative transcriptional regulator